MPSCIDRLSSHFSRRRAIAAAIAVSAALAAGCSTNVGTGNGPEAKIDPAQDAASAARSTAKPAKIALLLPLAGMGPSAAVAKSLKQAGEMALFERDNPNVQIITKDDGGTPEGARAAAEQAIRDGAEIVLGPLFSKSVSAVAPLARQANVPILAFSNDPRNAGNGVYLMSFLVRPEVDRIVGYSVSRGKRRFAALIPSDAYGDTVEPAFRSAVSRSGATLTHVERYPVSANAMLDPVKRVAEVIRSAEIAGAPIDVLFVPGGPESLPQLAPLLAYNGIDPKRVQLIGTGAWDYPNVGRETALIGGWFPSPDPRGWQDFSARFAKTFGSAPPRIASLAYDAVNVAITLSAGAPGQRYSQAAITNPRGFSGVDGTVTLTPDGLSERRLAVLEIQQFGNNVIDGATQSAISNGLAIPSRDGDAPSRSATIAPPVTGSVYIPAPTGF